MFDKAIIDTDRFMDLSMSAKALYFLLGMEADDEGFVSYKKVMRIHGGNEDDFKILLVKEFLIHFESGVVVITDWNSNNWLDSRRTRPTEYQKEKKLLIITKDKKYSLSNGLASIVENSIVENSILPEKSGDKDFPLKEKTNEPVKNDYDDFLKWYSFYPKKVGKPNAYKAWKKIKPDLELKKKLVLMVLEHSKSKQWQSAEFIPYPATWLNQERWNDILLADEN